MYKSTPFGPLLWPAAKGKGQSKHNCYAYLLTAKPPFKFTCKFKRAACSKGPRVTYTQCLAQCICLPFGVGGGCVAPFPLPRSAIHVAKQRVSSAVSPFGPLLRPHQNAKHFDVAEGKGRLYVALQRINSSIIACTYAYRRFAYVHMQLCNPKA
jgi:hypothetical protein